MALVTFTAGAASAPAIATKTLPNPVNGAAYSQTLAVSGGQAPYTWKLASGSFPDGLSINPVTGVVSGMPNGASWEYNYPFSAYVTVTDANGASGAKSYSMSLQPPPVAGAPAVTNYTLTVVSGTVNGAGSGSYPAGTNVTLVAGAAPAGEVFNSWTGATVANPLAASTTLVMPAGNVTVTATYSTPVQPVQQYALTVVNGTGNGTASGSFTAGTPVTLVANAAPAGEVFSTWTGATVTSPLSANTTLAMPAAITTVTATYKPVPLVSAPLAIKSMTLPPAMVGSPYDQPLTASGGTPPYTWTLSAGGLPAGLNLGTNSGAIAGIATASGSWVYSYTNLAYIEVADSVGASAYASYSLSVIPSTNITYTLTVNGGTGGGSYSANATVPIVANVPAGWVFLGWTGATVLNPQATNTSLIMPSANTVVTATFNNNLPPGQQYYLTVNNGTGSGYYAANTVVNISGNLALPGQVFQAWTGGTVGNALQSGTTIVMPTNDTTVTAVYGATANPPATIPQPVTSHPRLWITTNDIARLQSWAVAGNPMYASGIAGLLSEAISDYNTQFFPGGVANTNYPDFGDSQGYTGLLTENYLYIFGLNSLIDPNPAARSQYARCARNLLMYAMNQAALGVLTNAPFRDPLFLVYNRGNAVSEAWPLAVDWIYNATDTNGGPILSAADKATIRNVFMIWASECVNADTTGGDHPDPVDAVNNPGVLSGGGAYRYAANNYYSGHARLLTLMSLAMDPVDDPAVNPAVSLSVVGNSLRSYIADATGAWLYQQFAMFGDPTNVCAAYNLPATASVGLASGGLPPEGMLYGHSYSFLFGELLALKTAGFADPSLAGPQAALVNDPPVFDRFVKGFFASLVPAQQVPSAMPYLGLVYDFASYGDILRMYPTPDFGVPVGLLSMLDRQNGNTSRQNAERWYAINAVEGGAAELLSRVQDPWTWGVQDTIMDFMLLDPNATTTDPHAAYPVTFYDALQGRLVDRTDWSPSATLFDYRSSWQSINHQQADAGQFEFYRNGEWLTKGVANYDNNINGLTTELHNTLGLQNWCANGVPATLGWWEPLFWTNGSSWQLGGSAGDPVNTSSLQPAYDYLFSDLTKLYNRPSFWSPANAALDIQQANRSIIWLKPDYIVVYDRATSLHTNLFKRFNLALNGQPMATNNVITSTTPGGQNLYITELLPVNSQLSVFPVANGTLPWEVNPLAWLEPSTYRLSTQDPSNPMDTRFLHVLQGANAGVAATPATLFNSTSGTPMDGAIFGNTAVLFTEDVSPAFAGVTYTVPVNVNQHYVTGCVPGGFYNVSSYITPAGLTVTVAPASSGTQADSAGVLVLSF